MNWYKKARRESVVFETENSSDMRIFDRKHLQSNDGDVLPKPELLGLREYIYLSFVWVPEKDRRKGEATRLITDFVNKTVKPIFVELIDSGETQGMMLKELFLSLGFSVYDQGDTYVEMIKK